jgi:hypothetical protein
MSTQAGAGACVLTSTGIFMMANALSHFFPKNLSFFGTDEPICGGVLLITAGLSLYAWYEGHRAAHTSGIDQYHHQEMAHGVYALMGAIFTVLAIGSLSIAGLAGGEEKLNNTGSWFYGLMLAMGLLLMIKNAYDYACVGERQGEAYQKHRTRLANGWRVMFGMELEPEYQSCSQDDSLSGIMGVKYASLIKEQQARRTASKGSWFSWLTNV